MKTFRKVADRGSVIHLAVERFRLACGLDLLHLPYPAGTAPVRTAMVACDILLYINEMGSMRGFVGDKRLKVLGTLAEDRSPLYLNVPCAPEFGVPALRGFTAQFFYDLYVTTTTPPDRVDVLNKSLNRAMEDAAVKDWLGTLGYAPASLGGTTPKLFKAIVPEELARTEQDVRDARIPIEQ